MTVKKISFQLEEVQMRLWALNSITLAVHDAIVEGPNDAGNFHGALHMLAQMINDLEQEVKVLTDALFENLKTEKKGAV